MLCCTHVAWECLVCLLLCNLMSFAITERRDMGLYEVLLSVSFVWFWDWDYVSQLPCVRYYVFVKSSFKHTSYSLLYSLQMIPFSVCRNFCPLCAMLSIHEWELLYRY